MDTYEQLRREAAAKRDQAVQVARSEYKLAVRRINALRRQMTGKAALTLKTPDEGPVFDKVKAVLPHDRAFTIPEVTELMYSDRSGCRYREGTIRAQFQPLLAMGIIRRVGRRNGQVLWARPDADVEVCPFAGMTIPDIVEQLIGELGPMRITEMVVVMKERGYRPAEKERQTAAVLLRAITRFSGRFAKDKGGRWDRTKAST